MATASSVPTTIINFVKTIIGGLTICVLPHAFCQTGILCGALLYATCGAIHCIALRFMAFCVLKARAHGRDGSFSSLAETAFGGQAARAIVTACVFVVGYGVEVGAFIVVGDLLPEVFKYLGFDSSPWNSRVFWMTSIGWCIKLPLCFLPNLDSLKFSSLLGNIALFYQVGLLCAFAIGAIALPPVKHSVTFWPPPSSAHTSTLGMLECFPLFMFSLIATTNLPSLMRELKDPTIRRVDMVIVITNVIVVTVYILSGICGSVAFGASVEVNVLKSFPNLRGEAGGSLAAISRVAIVMTVITAFPLWTYPIREAVAQQFLKQAFSNLSFQIQALVTLVIFLLCWGLALVVEDLSTVLAFAGSTSQMMNGFVLPALFYLFCYLGVKKQGNDTTGINLQNLGSEATEEESSLQLRNRQWTLRRPAWVMAMLGVVLIPVTLAFEFWKMIEHE